MRLQAFETDPSGPCIRRCAVLPVTPRTLGTYCQRISWPVLAILLLLDICQVMNAQPRINLVPSGEDWSGLRPFCEANTVWSWGRLIGYSHNRTAQPEICSHDWNGKGERIAFGIPGAGMISLEWASAAPDGSIALVGSAYQEDGAAGSFVARISADRRDQIVTRESPYVPMKVVVSSDGVVWTLGWVLNESGFIAERNILRRYDKAGRVLSSTSVRVNRSRMRDDAVQLSRLAASADRIAWLTNGNEYIEFALDGREIFRMDGPFQSSGPGGPNYSMAMSQNNIVVIAEKSNGAWVVMNLDRATHTWVPAATTGTRVFRWGRLMGFVGEQLVIEEGDHVMHKYGIDKQPK